MTVDKVELKRPFKEAWALLKSAPKEIAEALKSVIEILDLVLPIAGISRFLGRQ
jgi:hypothetical protein